MDGFFKYIGFEDYLDYVNSISGLFLVWIKKWWKLFFLIIMILVVILFGIYKYIIFFKCMIWIEDYYEKVLCDIDLVIEGKIKFFDFNFFLYFKKVYLDSIEIFFIKKCEFLIWYGKNFDGIYEYFIVLGFYFEMGKSLKFIMLYIIDKYIKIINE